MIKWYNEQTLFTRSLIVTLIIALILPLVIWGVVEMSFAFPIAMEALAIGLACFGMFAMFVFIIWMLVYMVMSE